MIICTIDALKCDLNTKEKKCRNNTSQWRGMCNFREYYEGEIIPNCQMCGKPTKSHFTEKGALCHDCYEELLADAIDDSQ